MQVSAAVLSYSQISSIKALPSCKDFKNLLVEKFLPSDYAKQARDGLRNLRQIRTVSSYLAEFRNEVLGIPIMSKKEKSDRFLEGLKRKIRSEVHKAETELFEDCKRVALNIDRVLYRANSCHNSNIFLASDPSQTTKKPTPLKIGNFLHGKLSRA